MRPPTAPAPTRLVNYSNHSAPACGRSRAALILSGQLRTYRAVYPALKHFLLDPLVPSVFIFTEATRVQAAGVHTLLHELRSLYAPCSVVIDAPYESGTLAFNGRAVPPALLHAEPIHARKGSLPNFYQLWAGNSLKRSAERERNARYSTVIRMRPDLLLQAPLPPSVLRHSHTLWHSDYAIDPAFQVSDKLAVASSETMDHYASLWRRLGRYWQDPLGPHPPWTHRVGERLMKQHVDLGPFEIRIFHVPCLVVRPWMLSRAGPS